MPFEISWIEEGHIINIDVEGDVDKNMLVEISNEINTYFDADTTEKIHLLINESNMRGFPTDLRLVAKNANFLQHRKLDFFVIYGSNTKFSELIASVVSDMRRVRYRRVNTLEDALQYLEQNDSN